jgi:hypothetical protein
VFHLAQLNVGRTVAPVDDPVMAGFTGNLDRINALADAAPGFVWRLQTDSGNATDVVVDEADPLFIVNLSVWESLEAMRDYVYRSDHTPFLRRRREWFQAPVDGEPVVTLWWVPAGTLPTVADAMERRALLAADGPTPKAFTFRQTFPPS